eukprot:752541-Hanusia_phi.AAC.3
MAVNGQTDCTTGLPTGARLIRGCPIVEGCFKIVHCYHLSNLTYNLACYPGATSTSEASEAWVPVARDYTTLLAVATTIIATMNLTRALAEPPGPR